MHRPFRHSGKSGDGINRRGLAGSIRPDQSNDPPWFQREEKFIHRGDAAVPQGQVPNFERPRVRLLSPGGRCLGRKGKGFGLRLWQLGNELAELVANELQLSDLLLGKSVLIQQNEENEEDTANELNPFGDAGEDGVGDLCPECARRQRGARDRTEQIADTTDE